MELKLNYSEFRPHTYVLGGGIGAHICRDSAGKNSSSTRRVGLLILATKCMYKYVIGLITVLHAELNHSGRMRKRKVAESATHREKSSGPATKPPASDT